MGVLEFKIKPRLSPAKVNFWLKVGEKRRDGFHAVETLILPVKWGDQLAATIRQNSSTEISVHCAEMDLRTEDNLIYKAAKLFSETIPVFFSADFYLKKNVPPGAGLGGGSSNAATALLILKDWYQKNIGKGLHKRSGGLDKKMMEIARRLGSDVPLFLDSKPVWCSGRGDRLESVVIKKEWPIVILCSPDEPVATGGAYHQLGEWRKKRQIKAALPGKAAWLKNHTSQIPVLENDFQTAILEAHPVLKQAVRALTLTKAMAVKMSGSGSAFFGVYSTTEEAKKAAAKLRSQGLDAYQTTTLCS